MTEDTKIDINQLISMTEQFLNSVVNKIDESELIINIEDNQT